jgi:molecular chaperone Hsp33
MLGELMAAAVLLANNLKFRGSLTVQVQSPGPLRLLVVECTDGLGLRAVAKWDGELDDDADLQALAGAGRCVISLDPRDGSRIYQGIVAMEHGSVAALLEHYMQNSEQLATRIWLGADGERAAGLMLQKLPSPERGDSGDDPWERALLLAATMQPSELMRLAAEPLLSRLFADEAVRLFGERQVRFDCGCTDSRVANALILLGQQEVEEVLAEQGRIEVSCEFCNRKYAFDRVRAMTLFARRATTPGLH